MAERYLKLEDWLDDLCVRFIINLPQDNLSSVERICFQIEEAQWFYEDFIRPLNSNLPALSLRNFSSLMFSHCPLLSAFAVGGRHMQAFDEFLLYKNRIPVRGAIMLNAAMDSAVLVKGWKKNANWSFPRGKINKDEDDLICAIREVYEETGLDLEAAGLVPADRQVKALNVNIREQQMRLYVFKNVPMTTHFEPRTRKEISKIEWWRLSDLPSSRRKVQNGETEPSVNPKQFYMVSPFIPLLQKYIAQEKRDAARLPMGQAAINRDEFLTEDDRDESDFQAPYEVSAPESVSLKEAGDQLSRLLNVQSSDQISRQTISLGLTSADTNAGSALLALVQGAPGDTVSAHSLTQKPFEHLRSSAPVAVVAQQFPQHSYQSSLPYDQPSHLTHPQFNSHQSHPQQAYHQISQSRDPAYQTSPHHNQPQHLIHPQPLPPNVQKAVFTGGVVPSPPISQPVPQIQPSWNNQFAHSASYNSVHTQGLHSHVPHAQRAPVQLNNHSIALLNAFKSGAPLSSPATQGLQQSQNHPTIHSAYPHPQELAADLTQSGTLRPNPGSLQPAALTTMGSFMPRQEVNAAQKSALLKMFKSPPTESIDINGKISGATALPVTNTPSAVELSAVEPFLSSQQRHQERKLSMKPESKGKLPEIDSETAQTFRPTSILARPQVPRNEGEVASDAQKFHKIPPTKSSSKQNIAATSRKFKSHEPEANKVFAPQILKRPQQGDTIDVATMFKSPVPESVIPTAVSSEATTLPLRTQPPRHKENLLSLFGKVPQIPASNGVSSAPVAPRTSTIDIVSASSPLDPSSRSRVGSIVSADALSRRGSGSTLSKANENFLLGYLDAIAGGNQR